MDLYKELDAYQEGEFFALADHKIKNHLPQWIQFSSKVFWLNDPEGEKNLTTYSSVLDFYLQNGIHRDSTLFVFGGGATSDLGGFLAATILRGVKWIVVPTTLLAMVDGALGGKVAVNTPAGKNLAGSFHHPEKIFLCKDFLSTLDEENLQSGKGEILKYAFLSQPVYELVKDKQSLEKIIEACAKFKMSVVEKDFKEKGDRIFLNLGHTLGHAFESTLKIPHGLAVAMGMKYLFEILKKEESLVIWKELITALELPSEKLSLKTYPQFDKKKFVEFLQKDKKRSGEKIRLVLADGPGNPSTLDLSLAELKTLLKTHEDFQD